MAFNEQLKIDIRSIIASGLKRRTLTKCSKWAEACVHMGEPFPGPFSFDHHPWLREMHDPNCGEIVGQKSAQVGFTVAAMNRTFYKIDVQRQSVLYLLPTKTPDATDFSATRFDPALELSPYLSQLFSDVKNVATKRAGSAVLYIRGANSRSGLKSIPVATIMFDEYDEMPEENIPLALERTSGQRETEIWKISTPTIPNYGINELFLKSTQEHFHFPCPGCSKLIELTKDSLIVVADGSNDEVGLMNTVIICTECKKVLAKGLDTDCKQEFLRFGKWVCHGTAGLGTRGFYVNQLYSMAKAGRPYELGKAWILGRDNKFHEQEFYNSKLGLPHLVEGAKVAEGQVLACRRGHSKLDIHQGGKLVTMGVDVGKWLHVEVCAWDVDKFDSDINVRSIPTVLLETKLKEFEELDTLMYDFQINQAVVDANPEGRKAAEFAKRFLGHVKLCYYGKDKAQKTIDKLTDACDYRITVDRTSWMDCSLGRFHTGRINLPKDVSDEYVKHIIEPSRLTKFDPSGNPVATYVNKNADHFAHARNYAEIALPLAASQMTNRDIAAFL